MMASSLSSSSSLGQIRDSLHATPSETMWAIRLSAIDLGMGVHAVAAAQYYFACGAAHGLTIKEVESDAIVAAALNLAAKQFEHQGVFLENVISAADFWLHGRRDPLNENEYIARHRMIAAKEVKLLQSLGFNLSLPPLLDFLPNLLALIKATRSQAILAIAIATDLHSSQAMRSISVPVVAAACAVVALQFNWLALVKDEFCDNGLAALSEILHRRMETPHH
eukprot:Selendium_serpulae@DN6097_c0_g1_i1.p1